MQPRRLGRIAVILVASACGSKGGGETEATTGTTTSATETATTTATGTATEPTTSAGALCEPFLDQPLAGPAVAVTIENTRDTVAFVLPGPPCTSDPLLVLKESGGDSLRFRDTVCDFTCSDYFGGQCFCAADCALAPAIRLEPGGAFTYTWAGGVFLPVTPPAACFPEQCAAGCDQLQQAAAADYTFATSVGSEVAACVDSPSMCMCTPNAEGWCALPALEATAIGGVVAVEAMFAYPADTAVALVVK